MAPIPYENEYGLWVSLDEYNRTKRALWLARAERAKENVKYLKVMLRHTSPKSELFDPMVKFISCWTYTESKCRAYADKFKENAQC